jgi:hypothetical protein
MISHFLCHESGGGVERPPGRRMKIGVMIWMCGCTGYNHVLKAVERAVLADY